MYIRENNLKSLKKLTVAGQFFLSWARITEKSQFNQLYAIYI